MKPRSHKEKSRVIVYDADCIEQPGTKLFDPEYWRRKGAVVGEARGRGAALFLDTAFGAAVLRQYLRGGWPAKFSKAHYLFSGFERSRPLAEFTMLARLFQAGLPVPRPLAALCSRSGPVYTGWLLTARIGDGTPLADLLIERGGEEALWRRTGRCIRRFHEQGVVHADLNARNILLDAGGAVFLIDFDRARIRKGDNRASAANLSRLRRSLDKLWPASSRAAFIPAWETLMSAYRRGNSAS